MKSSIFEKNIDKISKLSPKFAQKLSEISQIDSDFKFVESGLGDANLIWKKMPLHDDIDPIEEAQNLVYPLKDNDENTITILFGFGLGYVFKKIVQEIKGKLIVYEPDAELLRLVFDVVDFSDDISSKKAAFVDNKEDLKEVFEKFFFMDSKVKLTYLNSYQNLYPQEFSKLKFDSEFLNGLFLSNYRNYMNYAKLWTDSVVGNIPKVLEHNNLSDLKDKFKNKPAVIISAGPSLDKTLDMLKGNEDKFVTFCVGTASKSLAAKGIKPDFLVMVEANNCITELESVDVSDVNLILQPMAHKVFHNLEVKRTFNYYQNNDMATVWLCDILGIDKSEYQSRGTVSYCAMVAAKILGCNPIILIGQDLAYLEGNCYSKGSAFSNLKCLKNPETNRYEVMPDNFEAYVESLHADKSVPREVAVEFANARLKTLNDGLLYVKSVKGEMIPTEAGYATFISHFESFATENGKNIKLINSSLGANLEGFKNIAFEEVLKKYCLEKINIEDIISSSLSESPFSLAQKRLVWTKIKEQADIIEKTLPYYNVGMDLCEILKKKYAVNDITSLDTKKVEQKLLDLFYGIENDFVNKHCIYKSFIIQHYFPIKKQFILFDPKKSMPQLINDIFNYFIAVQDSLRNGAILLKSVGDVLNESCNPKS